MTQSAACASDVRFALSLSTGKERDTESGNDYFGARYYASTMGRFMSPDWSDIPEAVPYADLGNPQSLNLYSYAGNNPLIHFDKDGHCWSWIQKTGDRRDVLHEIQLRALVLLQLTI
jgi:RHS repeat-associated protein